MRVIKFILLIFFLYILLNASSGYCFETTTHEVMNERIASGVIAGFSLDNYLKGNFECIV